MHFEQSAILTVHNHVITRNPRISVTHDKHDKHRTWFLHINNVQEEDRGRYMCQINTVTAKTQYGFVKVVGKPKQLPRPLILYCLSPEKRDFSLKDDVCNLLERRYSMQGLLTFRRDHHITELIRDVEISSVIPALID
ncbi:hypothetical protein GQX74_005811 [Glossina fuscipes]|nr:hypothetical protein GQX74_005811 [Glossina fuscipes]